MAKATQQQESADTSVTSAKSDPVEPQSDQLVTPAAAAETTETESAVVEPDQEPSKAADPLLTASQVLQRRMGLGKLIADRLVGKLTNDEQQSLSRAHAAQDFDEYSRIVALLQFRPAEAKGAEAAETRNEPTAQPAGIESVTDVSDEPSAEASESAERTTDEPPASDEGQIDTAPSNPPADESTDAPEPISEAEATRRYLADHPEAQNKDVVAALAEQGIKITSSQVSAAKRQLRDSE